MLYGATSKELFRLIKTKTGVILLSLAVLAIFIMPTFAAANNSGMTKGQASSASQSSMSSNVAGSSNASSNIGANGNMSANTGSNGVAVDIIAKNMAFNKRTITVPAGAQVTVNFDNQDSGIQHNVAFYTDSSASTTIYKGAIITGPKTTTYTFTAPSKPGTYFFRCDIHPTTMTGRFIVQ